MARREGIEVDGKRYVSTKVACNWWRVSQSTVRKYCKNDEIPGAFQDSKNNWCIPYNAIKPVPSNVIKQVLRLSIQLKANRKLVIDYAVLGIEPTQLVSVYNYLALRGLIDNVYEQEDPNSIPYNVELTDKGWELALSDNSTRKRVEIENVKDIVHLAGALAAFVKAITPAA